MSLWPRGRVPLAPGGAARPPQPGQSCGFALWDPCLVFGSSSRPAALRAAAAVERLPLTSNLPLIKPRRRAGPRGSPAAPGAGCHPRGGWHGTLCAGPAMRWGRCDGAEPRCSGMLDPSPRPWPVPFVPPCPPLPCSGGDVSKLSGWVWHSRSPGLGVLGPGVCPRAGSPCRRQDPCQASGCPQQRMPTRSCRGRPWKSWIGAWTSWRRCRPGTRSARWPPTR